MFLSPSMRIEVDVNIAKAIIGVKTSSNKELQRVFRQVNYLRRFVSNLSGKMVAFCDLLKLKGQEKFCWTDKYQLTFNKIKEYLAKPRSCVSTTSNWVSFDVIIVWWRKISWALIGPKQLPEARISYLSSQ